MFAHFKATSESLDQRSQLLLKVSERPCSLPSLFVPMACSYQAISIGLRTPSDLGWIRGRAGAGMWQTHTKCWSG